MSLISAASHFPLSHVQTLRANLSLPMPVDRDALIILFPGKRQPEKPRRQEANGGSQGLSCPDAAPLALQLPIFLRGCTPQPLHRPPRLHNERRPLRRHHSLHGGRLPLCGVVQRMMRDLVPGQLKTSLSPSRSSPRSSGRAFCASEASPSCSSCARRSTSTGSGSYLTRLGRRTGLPRSRRSPPMQQTSPRRSRRPSRSTRRCSASTPGWPRPWANPRPSAGTTAHCPGPPWLTGSCACAAPSPSARPRPDGIHARDRRPRPTPAPRHARQGLRRVRRAGAGARLWQPPDGELP